MKKILIYTLFMLCFIGLFCQSTFSQTQIIHRDPIIEKMVLDISAENLESYVRTLVDFGTRNNFSDTISDTRGIGAAWRWTKSEFEKFIPGSGGRLEVFLDPYVVGGEGTRMPEKLELKNVVARLNGADPEDDRVFLVSAHLDSRASSGRDGEVTAPGANDDASGVAMLLELARIMSKVEFPSTIIFIAVSGEEHGLWGASHMAEKAKNENWNLVAMLNNDMIGNSYSSGTKLNDNMKVRVFSDGIPAYEDEEMARNRRRTSGENDGKARQLARYVKEVGERYVDQLEVKLIYRNDRFLRGGDHTPFCRLGFTAVRICEYNENYDHTHKDVELVDGIQYGDLPEFVDYEYVRKNTGVNLATLANLALAPGCPQNVGIVVRGLSNSTTLRWDPPVNGSASGYFVLMRETHQPFWERKLFVKGTEATFPYSKDNYFFAVQAVDEDGHESLPVFPLPVR
jgi:hypothetical protein